MSGIIGGAGSKSGIIGHTELDYEEGTFTVTVTDTDPSHNCSYVEISPGQYTKVGNICAYAIYFRISSFNTNVSSQAAHVRGLPFTALGAGGVTWAQTVTALERTNWNTARDISCRINAGESHLQFIESVSGGDAVIWSLDTLDSDAIVRISGTYQTA